MYRIELLLGSLTVLIYEAEYNLLAKIGICPFFSFDFEPSEVMPGKL
jgi:hypothetical protein